MDAQRQPIFLPVPWPVWLLVGLILVPEIILSGAGFGLWGGAEGIGWRSEALVRFAFFDAHFEHVRQTGRDMAGLVTRTLSYSFVHFAPLHAGLAAAIALALGTAVARRFAPLPFLMLLILSAAAGAMAFGLATQARVPLAGAYPMIYGLIGAYSWTLFLAAGTDRRKQVAAFRLIGVLVVLQFIYRAILGGGPDWVADLAAFGAGFLLSFGLADDGPDRLRGWRDRLRQR
ncbi:rhomboid family intramembrane serine protease [Oceanomicrobium pacificus]|uniref:Rhomboid family intramembrane serine protease n=1 Tax=Oceanomicrobium pacificus TaxID=2692916 RepID=A0A6B0TJ86_9RHOB|nr:rhomboid family intramembrane serine protease [Oceanomicrobium pacificus]MXU64480.1 rhomboid family intramembrane serine protease [Oceanomicrobium pacificus]